MGASNNTNIENIEKEIKNIRKKFTPSKELLDIQNIISLNQSYRTSTFQTTEYENPILKLLRDNKNSIVLGNLGPDTARDIIAFSAIENLVNIKIPIITNNELDKKIIKQRAECIKEILTLTKDSSFLIEDFPQRIIRILTEKEVHLTEPGVAEQTLRDCASVATFLSFPDSITKKFIDGAEWFAKTADNKFIDEHTAPKTSKNRF
jgi:hypothetical protein